MHPQHWPEGMPVAGRRVVVIGSGATAVTLLPALVEQGAEHVTMLQRSPSYVAALPGARRRGRRAAARAAVAAAHRVVRGKNIVLSTIGYQAAAPVPGGGPPDAARAGRAVRLPEGYPVDTHFAPRYDPWDQRLCVAPDGDLFDAIADGRAEVVTDTIERFERDGIRLSSGGAARRPRRHRDRPADGARGGAEVVVDGEVVDASTAHVYKGLMLSDVPNLALAVGYTNASWTLRARPVGPVVLLAGAVPRPHGLAVATPRYDEPDGAGDGDRPLLDLTSGYVRRAADILPRQGRERPWRVVQSYLYDLAVMRLGRIDDGHLELR